MERHIFRERTSSQIFREPVSANACIPLQVVSSETPLPRCMSLARLSILCLSKSDYVVISWSPSGYIPVVPDCHDVLSSPCLLITAWQQGDTRNDSKIHVICYITFIHINDPPEMKSVFTEFNLLPCPYFCHFPNFFSVLFDDVNLPQKRTGISISYMHFWMSLISDLNIMSGTFERWMALIMISLVNLYSW